MFKDSQHVCAIVNRTHMAQHESEHAVTFVGHRKAVVATRYAVRVLCEYACSHSEPALPEGSAARRFALRSSFFYAPIRSVQFDSIRSANGANSAAV